MFSGPKQLIFIDSRELRYEELSQENDTFLKIADWLQTFRNWFNENLGNSK
jgi:hypothetical protein